MSCLLLKTHHQDEKWKENGLVWTIWSGPRIHLPNVCCRLFYGGKGRYGIHTGYTQRNFKKKKKGNSQETEDIEQITWVRLGTERLPF